MLLSGMHTISNITCKGCDAPLGWVYLKANDPAQRYKEGEQLQMLSILFQPHVFPFTWPHSGKYIMEKDKIMKVRMRAASQPSWYRFIDLH